MALDRRKFIKTLGAGAAVTALAPESLLASGSREKERRSLDLKHTGFPDLNCDVCVVGAGPSGIPAAISAAREGASVILVEEDAVVGGATTDMFVTYMCGAPHTGIYLDFIRELERRFPTSGTPSKTLGKWAWDGKHHWWMPSACLQVFNAALASYPNIKVMCGAPVVDVIVRDKGSRRQVQGVYIMRCGLLQKITAAVTIDATGSGFVAAKAGCEYWYGVDARADFGESIGPDTRSDKVQLCTQMFISSRTRRDARFPLEEFNTGVLDNDDKKWATQQTREYFENKDTGTYLHWGATVECPDTTDSVLLAEAQAKALKKLEPKLKALQEAGFATFLAPRIGVRETRRIKGDAAVKVDDVFNGVFPDDSVADAWYNIDTWGFKVENMPKVRPYGIPYRALTPRDTDGLLTAGRIISGSHFAMGSYRVQPICGTIGEAAGCAAALVARHKTTTRGIDVREIQLALDAKGVFDWYSNVHMNINNKPWK